MIKTVNMKQKLKLFSMILLPILVTQVGLYAMNFFDTVMSGKSGRDDLAGVAIGSSLWVPVFTGLSGILMALTPMVSHLLGGNDKRNVPQTVLQGIYLATALSVIVFILGVIVITPLLNAMNLTQSVQKIATQYLVGLSFGIFPLFLYTVLRSFIDALGQTRITMFITLLSLPINVLFNYILIFGKFGFPQLGGIGAGYASSITYWCIFIISVVVVIKFKPFNTYVIFKNWERINIRKWIETLKIGVPIGFAIFFETSIFAAVTLLMSQFNTNTIAAHQAALNFASLLYMLPLSISMALTICVGFEAGAKRYKDAKEYGRIGIISAVGMSLLFAIFLLTFSEQIASLYTTDQAVLALIKQFLFYAIFFQLSDAFGAPIQGALRGYKDVNVTLVLALISYWIIGLPVGYVLATVTLLGPFGYWIGLILGLTVGAILLFGRLRGIQRKMVQLHG